MLIGNEVCTGYLSDEIRDLLTAEMTGTHSTKTPELDALRDALFALKRISHNRPGELYCLRSLHTRVSQPLAHQMQADQVFD